MLRPNILIRDATVLTMNSKRDVITECAIHVQDGRIVAVGKTSDIGKGCKADTVLECRGKLVMPGLINGHTHLVSTLRRGLGADLALYDWLKYFKWPGEAQVTGEDAFYGALLGCIENIKCGATLVVENYYPPKKNRSNVDRVAEAIQTSGIRAVIARGYQNKKGTMPDEFIESDREILDEYRRIIEAWNGKADGRISTCVSPVNLVFCSSESIMKLGELMERYQVGMHSHVAEAQWEVDTILKEHGKRYIEVFNELGVLGPRFQAAHAVWLSDREIDLMAATGAAAIHNPQSNMYLASGVARVPEMLQRGVTVGLGTDSPTSHGNMDMVEALKFAACLQKVHTLNPTSITARQVLEMATINGAKAYGLSNQIGSLEVGKRADITIVNVMKPHIVPVLDPYAAVVYSANGNDVDTVLVDGEIVMRDRIMQRLREDEIISKTNDLAMGLVKRAYGKP